MSDNINCYEAGKVYKAKITDQTVTKNYKDQLQVVLDIEIVAKLKNDNNPGDGTEPCPQHNREVLITVVEDDYERLRMALRDLERLGFTDDDISKLHPDHPDFFSLVDKEVHVCMKPVNGNEYWNLARLREKPRPVAIEELKADSSRKATIAGARKRMREESTARKVKVTVNAGTPDEMTNVGY